MGKFIKVVLATLLIQTTAVAGRQVDDKGSLLAIEIEIHQNTLDGCTDCRCRVKSVSLSGQEQRWWAVFGLATNSEEHGWVAAGAPAHCGNGSFEDVADYFAQTVGNPYLILNLSTTASGMNKGEVSLTANLEVHKLTGFDPEGRPVFASSHDQRELSFDDEGGFTTVLLMPDAHEQEAFGIHDVLLQLSAVSLDRKKPATYGSVSVTGDVPGAAVFIDEGFVGRLIEGEPLVISNILKGKRQIRLEDFSGRETVRNVKIKKNSTTEVELKVLDLHADVLTSKLVAIGKNPQGNDEYLRTVDGAMVVNVPAGLFLMGSLEGVGEANERPQHEVDLPAFLIDKMEVTWRQFRKFSAAEKLMLPKAPIWGRLENYPISFILLSEAQAYCEWAGARLPSEAEWEKAARGTDGRIYSWGDTWDASRCNTISGGMHRPEAAGSLPGCVSPYGVLDMSGNVQEWTSDLFKDYKSDSTTPETWAQGGTSLYVMRGGGWMTQPIWTRTAYRHKRSPNSRLMDHGFRCAQDMPEKSE